MTPLRVAFRKGDMPDIFEQKSIPVTVDKSHILTIGEKLYTEKTSFIRELVNNAYDADATRIDVTIEPTRVQMKDNGSGMDEAGLRRYFTIGASEKRAAERSEKFARKRIGEFGIGKFSALAACKRFEIETQRGSFHAKLVFDKEGWTRHEDWHLNIDVTPPDPAFGTGTCVTLHELNITFAPGNVRRYLVERTPIHAPYFAVYVNSVRVSDEIVSGRQMPLHLTTPCGTIDGQLVILPSTSRSETFGIGVAVKGVLVRYESFGMERSHAIGARRITGRVNADFLTITSSRDDFLRDTAEFRAMESAMRKELKNVYALLRKEADHKTNLQTSRVLRDAMHRVGRAMRRQPEIFPEVQVPVGDKGDEAQEVAGAREEVGYAISEARFLKSQDDLDPTMADRLKRNAHHKKPRGRAAGIMGDKSVIRHLRVAQMDIAVRMEHLGVDEDESLTSGGIIFINVDHALYRTYHDQEDFLTLHIARILTKELALRIEGISAANAFAIQSELLTDALKKSGI